MKKLRHPRFVLFLAVLLVAGAAALRFTSPDVATVVAFDLAAFVFLVSVAPLWWHGTPSRIRSSAARDDGSRILLLAVTAIVVVVILVAVGLMVGTRSTLGPADLVLVVATLLLAWGFVNTVYALHYAHIYYDQSNDGADRAGLKFPETMLPAFSDFSYFSFVVGMTFQVSDVAITSPQLRRVVTVHALLAFFFNLGVLALTINVLAGVLRG